MSRDDCGSWGSLTCWHGNDVVCFWRVQWVEVLSYSHWHLVKRPWPVGIGHVRIWGFDEVASLLTFGGRQVFFFETKQTEVPCIKREVTRFCCWSDEVERGQCRCHQSRVVSLLFLCSWSPFSLFQKMENEIKMGQCLGSDFRRLEMCLVSCRILILK
jgi:hypothetical protein